MSPDDPRHGRNAGYDAGCRDQCCKAGAAEYERLRRYDAILGRPPRTQDATGTNRRMQALVALGYSYRDLSEHLGVGHDQARKLALPMAYVRSSTADRVKAVFEKLCMTPAADSWRASYARTVARKSGWVPPLAWTDIDDPNEQPDLGAPDARGGNGGRSIANLLEDAEWLADSDATLSEVVERLAVKLDTFRDTCARAGRSDLYWRLARREPDGDLRWANRRVPKTQEEVA